MLIARLLQFLQGFARQGVQFLPRQGRGGDFFLIGHRQRQYVFVIRAESGFQLFGVLIVQDLVPQPAGFVIQIRHQADIGAVFLHCHHVMLLIAAGHAREAFRRHGFANGRKGYCGGLLRQRGAQAQRGSQNNGSNFSDDVHTLPIPFFSVVDAHSYSIFFLVLILSVFGSACKNFRMHCRYI